MRSLHLLCLSLALLVAAPASGQDDPKQSSEKDAEGAPREGGSVETDAAAPETPDSETPDSETPESETPESETPESETPEDDAATEAPESEPSAESEPPPSLSADLSLGPDDDSIPTPGELDDRLERQLPEALARDPWTSPTPVFTLHGYLRLRGELMDTFWLGRVQLGQGQMEQAQTSLGAATQAWQAGDPASPEIANLERLAAAVGQPGGMKV